MSSSAGGQGTAWALRLRWDKVKDADAYVILDVSPFTVTGTEGQ